MENEYGPIEQTLDVLKHYAWITILIMIIVTVIYSIYNYKKTHNKKEFHINSRDKQ